MEPEKLALKCVCSCLQTQMQQNYSVLLNHFGTRSLIIPHLFRERRVVTRVKNYTSVTVPRYLPDEFRSNFRLTRQSFDELTARVGVCNVYNTQRGPAVDPVKDLLMFLWFIGNTESFRYMSDRFNVGKSSYHRSINRVAKALVEEVMPNVIQWPTGNRIRETSEAFGDIAGMLNVVGAVDGSQIPIKAPTENPNSYYNRKKFHSLVLLASCNADLLFTYVWTGNPGSTHDATVLRSSELFQQAENLIPRGYYILGDSAFPLLSWMVTPFRDYGNLSRDQRLFNTCHWKTRQVIERCFGLLKSRFRRLLRFDGSDMKLMVYSILSACVLHNLCVNMNEEGFECEDEGDNDCNNGDYTQSGFQMDGVRLRNHIMHHLVQIH
ncbi:putative nuclease HARBI1 [Saccostrea cucullata]|uniref:putative nuclease HARBI1 n=1 Tax=Saccostrea cuccullata TaxID=36930 RepID=UPI002ED68771